MPSLLLISPSLAMALLVINLLMLVLLAATP
jgi:hypothetical protein